MYLKLTNRMHQQVFNGYFAQGVHGQFGVVDLNRNKINFLFGINLKIDQFGDYGMC